MSRFTKIGYRVSGVEH